MDDLTQLQEDVLQPYSVLEAHHTARCVGYQFGATGAFCHSYAEGIDSYHVGGVSLTHGGAGS